MFGFNYGVVGVAGASGGGSWAAWSGSADGVNQDTSLSGLRAGVIALSSTTFLVVCPNGSSLNARVGTISGTSVSYGVSVNLNASHAPASIQNFSLVVVDTNKVMVAYNSTANSTCYGVVLTVSGTTITAGSSTDIVSNFGTVDASQQLTTLTTSSVLFAYRASSGSNIIGVVLSISGTAITVNTPTTIISGSSTVPSVVSYTAGKVLLYYTASSTGYPTAVIVNVSGTSIGTIGTPVTIESSATAQQHGCVVVNDTSSVIAMYVLGESPTILKAVVLSLSGNTVTVNSILSVTTASNIQPVFIDQLNSTEYMGFYDSGTTVGNAKIITISGTTLSAGSEVIVQASESGGSVAQEISKVDGNTVINAALVGSEAYCKVLKRS